MRSRSRSDAPARTSSVRAHRFALVASAVLAVVGVALVAVGTYAWSMPKVRAQSVVAGRAAQMSQTPWFDQGATLFADTERVSGRSPASWGCSRTHDGTTRRLSARPDVAGIGTRVVGNHALTPVVTVGHTDSGDTITCSGAAANGTFLQVLPTDTGIPRVPMALVVAGVGLIGGAWLSHPRARGIRRFGT